MISVVSIGCGRSNQDSGKKVTINILNYKRETVDILQKMIDKFEKENPNIHIQMDSPSDALTILKTRLVKENPPDIAILGGHTGDPIEIGAATGKIKDKNYLVLLVKKAA